MEIDSETGSARITSQAQAYSFDTRDDVTIGSYRVGDLWLVPDVTHVLINPGVLSQLTQSYSARWFNNSSGFTLNAVVPGTVGELVDLNADGWVCTRVMPAVLDDFNYIDNVAPH